MPARTARPPLYRDRDTAVVNTLLLAAIGAGWPASFALMAVPSIAGNLVGVALCAQTMVWAAYLLHDAAHQSLFARPGANCLAGEVLSFVAGGSYASFERIRRLHIRHHVDRADITCFDYQMFLRRRALLLRVVQALEWGYVPATEALMSLQIAWGPLLRRTERKHLRRSIAMLLVRIALLVLLGTWSPRALVLYLVAAALLLHVLNFMDSFQHTYPQHFLAADEPLPGPRTDRRYEAANTFSNPISLRHRWLNVVVLNFGFHNAHHAQPTVPWFRLPALHDRLYAGSHGHIPRFPVLVRAYHRHRVRRVLGEVGMETSSTAAVPNLLVGAHGVSFLTVM